MDQRGVGAVKVILLAAGRGSRLGERTKDKPKCLCELHGRTLLDRCLDSLRQAGIQGEDIGVVTGYRGDLIQIPGAKRFVNPNWEQTNMFVSLTMAREWLEREPCIVCYSDVVFTPEAVAALKDSAEPLSITYYTGYWELWQKRMPNPLDDLETFKLDKHGNLTEIGQPPRSRADIQGQFMGLIRFTPEGWNWVTEVLCGPLPKPVERMDMTTLLNVLLQRGAAIQAIPTDGLWLECDTESDIELYEREYRKILCGT